MIRLTELDTVLVHALPELASDRADYETRRSQDPEFTQSFFSFSFVPTLQAALDRGVHPFCEKAFRLIEQLVVEGAPELKALLHEEFFDYGPACEKWMVRALPLMGSHTRDLAENLPNESS
jgi:hypothetical protein